jgi:hypothetical protein
MSLVLCLQYFKDDMAQAMRLARLIADIQPAWSSKYEFMFVPRFDCALDRSTVRYVSRKFNVWTHVSTRREMGWPAGCNGVAHDVFMDSLQRLKDGRWAHVDGVWFLEGDSLPLSRDWLDKISAEWKEARDAGKVVMGAWQSEHSPEGHLNGNMLFVPDLASRVRGLEGCPPHMPWDTFHAAKFAKRWHKSSQMVNFYKRIRVKEEELWGEGKNWAFVHGVKDDSGYELVKARLLS